MRVDTLRELVHEEVDQQFEALIDVGVAECSPTARRLGNCSAG